MNIPNVVLDTNIIISSFLFGGKPRSVFELIAKGKIISYVSPAIIYETLTVLSKKFTPSDEKIKETEKILKEDFILVYPQETLHILKDEPDNRILETALAGNCAIIVTGDKEMLKLKKYKSIRILSATDFLKNLNPQLVTRN